MQVHYNLVSVNLQVYIVVNNFSVPILCHIPCLPCQVRVLFVLAPECRGTVLGARNYVCMYVRPQKHALKQHGCMSKPQPLKLILNLRESDAACMLSAEADHNSLWSIRERARR